MDAQEHKKTYSIGDLAREFGVSLHRKTSTLRSAQHRPLSAGSEIALNACREAMRNRPFSAASNLIQGLHPQFPGVSAGGIFENRSNDRPAGSGHLRPQLAALQ